MRPAPPALDRGKGKRLEPNKFEGEQETESRKRAQADCQRLILPKGKDEIPDVFIRRLDAHRTAQEALIVPLTPPEVGLAGWTARARVGWGRRGMGTT